MTELIDVRRLTDAAVALIVEGRDDDAIVAVAGLSPDVSDLDARDAAVSAADALDIDLTDDKVVRHRLAAAWMRAVVDGDLDPYDACRQIMKHVVLRLPDPDADPYRSFAGFMDLWEEQPDDRGETERLIRAYAGRLLDDQAGP